MTTAASLRLLACLSAAIATCACTALRSDYQPPDVHVASAWQYGDAAPAATAGTAGGWWQAYQDADLDRFVDSVLERNNDLAAAVATARQAHLQAELNAAQFGPRVSADLGASDTTQSGSDRTYSAGASLSYELDLWGANKASRDASYWEAEASEEDRGAIKLSLTGSAVTLYWQLAYLNVQVASAAESVTYSERVSELVQQQYRAGAVSSLEVSEAEQSLRSQRSELIRLQQSRIETRHAIALLRDGEVWPEADEPQALPVALPAVDEAIPATVLGRRPDLRAAESRLRSTLASGDVTRLSYYPGLALTASGGATSTALSDLLKNPVGTLTAMLTLPFLQANDMVLNRRITEAQYEAAALDFRQTLQTALYEVEDALSARTQLAAQSDELEAALRAAQTAERLYEARYRAGAATLRDWLDAQERRRQATLTLQANQVNQLSNHAMLNLALGGSAAAS